MQQQQQDDDGAAAAARASREEAEALRKRMVKQHDACERAIDLMIGSNRYIRHMLGSLNARGCPVSPRHESRWRLTIVSF
jgi:hypothetical protein